MTDTYNSNSDRQDVIVPCEPDSEGASAECLFERPRDSCSIVILGATGDLTARKLMPALFNLYQHGGLPNDAVDQQPQIHPSKLACSRWSG